MLLQRPRDTTEPYRGVLKMEPEDRDLIIAQLVTLFILLALAGGSYFSVKYRVPHTTIEQYQ